MENLVSLISFPPIDVMLNVSLCAARERILSNLQKHPVPRPAPELQQQKAPVAEVPTACVTDCKAAAELLQQDLSILQDQARYIIQTLVQQWYIVHIQPQECTCLLFVNI